jgi:polar amino acid transport system substrate-binding protein
MTPGPALPAAAVADLAPSGTLRVAINFGNPILARRDPASGAPGGVSVDLARELAARLGVPVEFVTYDGAGKVVDAVRRGEWDVAFLAIDPARAVDIRYTAAYVLIEGAYLVREASPLRANEEVDRPGTRVMVGAGSAYDLFLTRELKQATIVRTATSQAVVDEFLTQGVEVAAGVRQQLEADARRVPGLRLLPGRFMAIHQAMGLPRARGEAGAAALAAFVETMKASGFVAQALERHRVQGASVAPPAAAP